MKNILIISEPEDIHAAAVAWALSEMDQNPYLWFIPDFPSLQSISILNLNSYHPGINIKGININFENRPINAVWMRRFYPPTIPTFLAKADQTFAKREYIYAIRSTLSILKVTCPYWINPLESNWIDNKALQLHIASQLEFRIPETLISNNPIEVRRFLIKHKKEMIYKSFSSMTWSSKKEVRRGETTLLTPEDLLDDKILSISPGIFQVYVDKAYEVRITVIGEKVFTIALYSQKKEKIIDWRLPLYATDFPTEIIVPPKEIYKKISAFMSGSNLLFGCFDFIVTNQGEWVFLEVNPMGQFLWIEELHPEFFLLDEFCRLLIADSKKIIKKQAISFMKFRDEIWEERQKALITKHIVPEKNCLSFEGYER